MISRVSPFFNYLSFILHVECDPEEEAPSGVRFQEGDDIEAHAAIDFENVKYYGEDDDGELPEESRHLSEKEWRLIAYKAPEITLTSEKSPYFSKTFCAANGSSFSVMELLQVVEKWEQLDRRRADFFGEVDTCHIFFEGLHYNGNGTWVVHWGS
jgi:hypothetical protein